MTRKRGNPAGRDAAAGGTSMRGRRGGRGTRSRSSEKVYRKLEALNGRASGNRLSALFGRVMLIVWVIIVILVIVSIDVAKNFGHGAGYEVLL
jgi:hypothetical protein